MNPTWAKRESVVTKILLAFFWCFCSSLAVSQNSPQSIKGTEIRKTYYDCGFLNLKGEVKEIEQRVYKLIESDSGKVEIGLDLWLSSIGLTYYKVNGLSIFDEQGNRTEYHREVGFDKPRVVEKWAFNNEDEVVEQSSTYDSYEYSYLYDDDGGVIEKIRFEENGQTDFSYRNGKLVGQTACDYNGNQLIRYAWEYDANGYEISMSEFDKSDNLRGSTTYTRDKFGNALTKKSDYPGNAVEESFNQAGLKTEQLVFESGELKTKSVSGYDSKNRPILRESYNGLGEVISRAIIKRNEYGDYVSLTQWQGLNGNLQQTIVEEFLYEYDNYGNWIRADVIRNDNTVNIIRRRIEYFK